MQKMNFEKLYKLAYRHNCVSIIYPAIKNLTCTNIEPWEVQFDYSCRKNLMLDKERNKIFKFMDKNDIWHMPLKGIVLQKIYPEYGMRQMVDNDILFDKKYEKKVNDYMIKNGYKVKPGYMHNEYDKAPLYNFELHKSLCTKNSSERIYGYFTDKKRIQGDKNLKHLSNNDFYLYQTYHAYNHNLASGIGIRQLIDTYIVLKNLDINIDFIEKTTKKLNVDYLKESTKQFNIENFEKNIRHLSLKLFKDPKNFSKLNDDENKQLSKYLESTTMGTLEQHVGHKLEIYTKNPKTFFTYFFPSLKTMQQRGLNYAKHKAFLPAYWARWYYDKLKKQSLLSYIKAAKKYRKNK